MKPCRQELAEYLSLTDDEREILEEAKGLDIDENGAVVAGARPVYHRR